MGSAGQRSLPGGRRKLEECTSCKPGQMQQPAGRRRPSRAAVAAAAVAAALALTAVLLVAQRWRAGSPNCTGVHVPEVPGSELARQWLCSYYAERERRGASPRWPAAAGTRLCGEARGAAPGGQAAPAAPAVAQQTHRKWHLGGQAEVQEPLRQKHLVLAAVGDGWAPGADANRRAASCVCWMLCLAGPSVVRGLMLWLPALVLQVAGCPHRRQL